MKQKIFQDSLQSVQVSDCPVCSGATSFAFDKDCYAIRRCLVCDYLYVGPRPSLTTIINHYATAYRGATEDFYPKAGDRRWRGFWQSLLFLPYVTGKTVLDLGCGGGFMVEALGRFARETTGIDISENSIAYARKRWPKHRFFAEDLSTFTARGEQFDFVFSSEVLEHVLDPDEYMTALQSAVKPGGFTYVSAPDAGHKAVPKDIRCWGDICPPEHLQWFNIHNLTLVFAKYGFVLHRRMKSRTPSHSVIFRRVES